MSQSDFTMHGKWSQPGVPHKGWTCVDVEPLDSASAICGMCESQPVRFVHIMTHPDYPGELGCGCDCAGRMEDNYEAAERRDALVKNVLSRRGRWLTRKWRVSRAGRPYIKVDGYHVVIFKSDGAVPSWGFKVTSEGGSHTTSRAPHSSVDEAKLKAFDTLTLMKADKENWLKQLQH